jgi:hypothetical protein
MKETLILGKTVLVQPHFSTPTHHTLTAMLGKVIASLRGQRGRLRLKLDGTCIEPLELHYV